MSPKIKKSISMPPKTDNKPELHVQPPVTEDDIDDLVDTWHAGGTGMPLHEFLGLTREQYARWVEQPDTLHPALYERTHVRPPSARQWKDVKQAADRLKHVSDPTRLQVILILAKGEKHVAALYSELGQSPPAISHHLALLRHGGIIAPRRHGKHNYYELTEAGEELVKVVKNLVE